MCDAHSQIFKERQNVQSYIRTFSKSEDVRCANVRLPNPVKNITQVFGGGTGWAGHTPSP